MIYNTILQSLLEAADDEKEKKKKKPETEDEETDPKEKGDDNASDEKDAEAEDPDNDTSDKAGDDNTDDAGTDNAEPDTDQNPDENPDDAGAEGDDSEHGVDTGDLGDDSFSLDGDDPSGDDDGSGGGGDGEAPPDGLVDPNDDGSGDTAAADEDAETNVQTLILSNMSELDRMLAKRKCYNDFRELHSTITSFLSTIREDIGLEPEVRDKAVAEMNTFVNGIETFLVYRFSYMSYEETLENYLYFVKSMNIVINYVKEHGIKKKKSEQ